MAEQRTGSRFQHLAWRLLEFAQRETAREERERQEREAGREPAAAEATR